MFADFLLRLELAEKVRDVINAVIANTLHNIFFSVGGPKTSLTDADRGHKTQTPRSYVLETLKDVGWLTMSRRLAIG